MSDCYIARNQAVAARALGGDMVIMAPDSSLFTLNEVGTAIWEAADGCTPLADIIQGVVCMQFDVDPETARGDAEAFVERLAKHGVLLVSDKPITGAQPGWSAQS